MSLKHRPDRQPDYPKTPSPQADTSPDEARQIEDDQHHPFDTYQPKPPQHPQNELEVPQHDTHTLPEPDEFPPHTNPPGPIKPEPRITQTGIEH